MRMGTLCLLFLGLGIMSGSPVSAATPVGVAPGFNYFQFSFTTGASFYQKLDFIMPIRFLGAPLYASFPDASQQYTVTPNFSLDATPCFEVLPDKCTPSGFYFEDAPFIQSAIAIGQITDASSTTDAVLLVEHHSQGNCSPWW